MAARSANERCPRCHHLFLSGIDNNGLYLDCLMCGYHGELPRTGSDNPPAAFPTARGHIIESGPHWLWCGKMFTYAPGLQMPVLTWKHRRYPANTIIAHLATGQPRSLWSIPDCGADRCVRPDHTASLGLVARDVPDDGLSIDTHLTLLGRIMARLLASVSGEGHLEWQASFMNPLADDREVLRPIFAFNDITIHPHRLLLRWVENMPDIPCNVSKCLHPSHQSPIILTEIRAAARAGGTPRPWTFKPVEVAGADPIDRLVARLARAG